MSTSHYSSRPYRGPQPAPNTRRWTLLKVCTIGALLIADILALAGSRDLVEDLVLVCLVLVNLWAMTR